MKAMKVVLCAGIILSLFAACNKDSNGGKASLAVRMTDAPAAYDAVNIDLQSVVVTGSGGADVVLNTTAGIYNLLDLANGVDTLIATASLEPGDISQIRLVLGSNNTIVVNGTSYPLSTPSAQQSGLKLQVHKTLEAGVAYAILLDFDAQQSIVEKGNGEYQLKPVIRTIDAAISGAVKGSITPIGTIVTVTATANGVSYSSITNVNGQFIISGLPAGTYDITLTPPLPLLPVTVTGVTVTTGVTTDIGVQAF